MKKGCPEATQVRPMFERYSNEFLLHKFCIILGILTEASIGNWKKIYTLFVFYQQKPRKKKKSKVLVSDTESEEDEYSDFSMEEAVETYDNIGEIDTSPDSSRHPSRASSSNRSMTPSTMDETVTDQEAEWNKLIKPCYLKLRRYDDKSLEAKSKLVIHMLLIKFSNAT